MSSDDNIDYSGPSKKWGPLPGHSPGIFSNRRKIQEGKYSNLDLLKRNLEILIAETTDTIIESEKILRKFNLSIEQGSQLEKAQEAEWPSELGEPKDYITYSEHKVMNFRSTRGSNFIRKEYNNAIRGPWGTPAADVSKGSENLRSEAIRIQNFIENYISQETNEPSQDRAIELFQDWALQAIDSSGQLRYLIAAKDKASQRYSKSELDQTTPSEARNYQAILQVQLNKTAVDIDKIQEDLEKHLGSNADLFYDSFLGPSLKFRTQISSKVLPKSDNILSRDMTTASRVFDEDAKGMLSDLMRRNEIFIEKSGLLVARIQESDMRRKTIQDLGTKAGMPRNTFTYAVEDVESIDLFEVENEGWIAEAEKSATPNYTNSIYVTLDENRFKSEHNKISGRQVADAHPQYLLRDKGSITGDIFVDPGVKIDGVELSTHAHTGVDGSAMIDGSSIVPGTLFTSAFSTEADFDGIADFRLVGYDSVTSITGDTTYEATLAWEGNDGRQFEVQVTRITQ